MDHLTLLLSDSATVTPMDLTEWADAERLSGWVREATSDLLGAVSDFSAADERWLGPQLEVVNPPIWEIGHVAWFAEWFVLRQLHGHEPLMDGVDQRYDSAAIDHGRRWDLAYPDPQQTANYVRRVGEALLGVVADDRGIDSTHHYAAYAVAHYDAHCEALAYTRQTLNWGHLAGWSAEPTEPGIPGEPGEEATRPEVLTGDAVVAGGRCLLGASRAQPFVMDNEKWAHPVEVASFTMAITAVTVAEFEEFVGAGGYATDSLWEPDGLRWRNQVGATAPVYWREGSHGWQRRVGATWVPTALTPHEPMVHVSWWEAQAFCAWAGRRLPTEAEWEVAATTAPTGERQPWFPWGCGEPTSATAALGRAPAGPARVDACGAGDGPWGHRQLIGNVWEWTSSTFEPYPHFEPDAYRDNSEPWFGSRKVLRGGSWATSSRYVRSTFRNYFEPHRRDVFAGFRTCAR